MKKCTIVIKDEVNAKIQDLELETRKLLVKKFEFEVPGARFLPSVKLGRWNGKSSYFTISGASYINLLPDILPILDQQNYDIELIDLRTYSHNFKLTQVSANTFSDRNWPKGHVAEGQPIVLRDYQVEIINNFLQNQQALQEVATGAGKTIMTAALSKTVESYGRSIVIVPNKSLVTQTEEDYINMSLDVGVFFGDRKEYGKQHTICTWQSLNNLLKDTKNGVAEITIAEFLENVICVIVDEVHMAKADALKQLLTSVMSQIPIRWGLTGTVPKADHDRLSIIVSLGPVINKLAAVELQEKGVLARCHVNIVQFKDDVDFKNYQSELKYLLENDKRLDTIANLVSKISDSGNTLVLVDRVLPGKQLVEKIPDSVFISGETKLTERKEEYDEVATASNKVIVATYGVAAVGINIPRIFNLVLIEPGKSFVRVIQSIGRGIRKAEDKDFVQIWDITSNCKFSKRHLTQRKTFYTEANYPFSLEKLSY
ncbi:DEAD/DEAH box helicase [bacterium]|nr:DEAD/DEAH box helicase [bacterium]